jgi:RNA polymerase sigma-70 factor (ECF subfamily)
VGQFEELTKWWQKVEPSLMQLAFHYTNSSESAKELVQDVAVLTLRNLSRLPTEEEFHKWAHIRLHWLGLDRLRVGKGQSQTSLDDTRGISTAPTQEREVLLNEVWRCIHRLPKRQRIVLSGMLEDRPNKEMANELQVTEATVRSLQRHARKSLIEMLIKE